MFMNPIFLIVKKNKKYIIGKLITLLKLQNPQEMKKTHFSGVDDSVKVFRFVAKEHTWYSLAKNSKAEHFPCVYVE